MGKRKLTGKMADFVAFLPKVDWIATDAVLKAKYKAKDRQTAAEIGSRLCKKSQVSEAISKMMDERLRRAGIYAERVLLELGKIGFSDISKAYNEDGTLKLPKDWPEELRGVISGVETLEKFSSNGESRDVEGYIKKLRTYDKVKSLELLGKHLKLFPTETKGEGDRIEPTPLTNIELSAKIRYLVQLAIQRQQEQQQKPKEIGHDKG